MLSSRFDVSIHVSRLCLAIIELGAEIRQAGRQAVGKVIPGGDGRDRDTKASGSPRFGSGRCRAAVISVGLR